MPVHRRPPSPALAGHALPQSHNPQDFLEEASPEDFNRCKRIIQSSFPEPSLEEHHTVASKNGLVLAAYHAYSDHHHLTIRPEDIWFAIITQLSSYVNANAEKLRSIFFEHKGQKHLQVETAEAFSAMDFGALAQRMTHEVAKKVKDVELRAWIMPAFSTTTDTDRVVASVLFMGAMQEYFSYQDVRTCGIPSVTLLGEITDYENILARLDKLDQQLGDEPAQFAAMLRPILRHMILSFREPTEPGVVSFWNRIADRHAMSGSSSLTGWITRFASGTRKGKPNIPTLKIAPPKQMTIVAGCLIRREAIEMKDVPGGCVTVPVTVNDDGDIYGCRMLAGSLGIRGLPEDSPQPSLDEESAQAGPPDLTGIKPLTGWMIYETK